MNYVMRSWPQSTKINRNVQLHNSSTVGQTDNRYIIVILSIKQDDKNNLSTNVDCYSNTMSNSEIKVANISEIKTD